MPVIKRVHSKHAVSEVIGVVLLLGITISLFAVLNFYVFHFDFNPSTPSVNLVGTIDKANHLITIEHNGGESLGGSTQIIITIGSDFTDRFSVSERPSDIYDDKWDFGEIVQYSYEGKVGTITGKYIQATVVDPVSNTILLSVILQEGVN